MSESDSAPMSLTERQEDVVVSRILGLTVAEIAAERSISESAVKKLSARGCNRVKCCDINGVIRAIGERRVRLSPVARQRLRDRLGLSE